MAVEVPDIPFNNLESLIDSEYQITLLKDSSMQHVFESAKSGPYRKAWKTKFMEKDLSLQIETKSMLDLVLAGKVALYEGLNSAMAFREYQECLVKDVGFTLNEVNLAFALSKDSPFKEAFNRALMKMIENGQLKKIQVKNSKHVLDCDRTGVEKPMRLENVLLALNILIVGGISSSIIYCFEWIKLDCQFPIESPKSNCLKQLSQRNLIFFWLASSVILSMVCFVTIHQFK